MAEITSTGRKLYQSVQRKLTTDHDFMEALETCSLLARHERTYHHIQERWCSEEMSERTTADLEKREKDIEGRVSWLAKRLLTPTGPMEVKFEGDPRGAVVKLIVPGDDPDQNWIAV